MDTSFLIAAGIIGSIAGGLGLTYALRTTAIRAFQASTIAPVNALPVEPESWKEILYWAFRFGKSQVTFGNEVGLYMHFFAQVPTEFPHWETLDQAIRNFHNQEFLKDSRYNEFNVRKVMDGLARFALLYGKGGGNVLVYAMRREMSGGGRYYTPSHLEKHPGYPEMVTFCLTHQKTSMDWGTTFRPSYGQLLLQLHRRYHDHPELTLGLLTRMRDQYQKIYPQLFVEGSSPRIILTRMFFNLPPQLLSEVYGKEYEKVFSEALNLMPAPSPAGIACRKDQCRPVVHLGFAACPVCWNPAALETGVNCITGVVGTIQAVPTDELQLEIPFPFNLQQLPYIEKLVLGPVSGVNPDALVDQALVFADRLPTPVRIVLSDNLQPAHRQVLMVQDHNTRIETVHHV